jgi:hypothetical protein
MIKHAKTPITTICPIELNTVTFEKACTENVIIVVIALIVMACVYHYYWLLAWVLITAYSSIMKIIR